MAWKASHVIDVPPQRAADVILSPEGTRQWFAHVDALQADAAWPGVGSHMRWTASKGRIAFDAQVVENRLPESLTMLVKTPTALTKVIHRFEGLPESRTRYVKIVEPRWQRRLHSLLPWVLLGSSTRSEVRRAAQLATAPGRGRGNN